MATSILRKITLKAVVGKFDFDKLIASENKALDLMKVFGVARKAKPDQSDLGAFIRFSGAFRAVNLETGEMFQSGTMILPGIAQDLLLGALDGEGIEEVNFGFKIGVHYDPTSVTKYVYDVTSLIEPSQDDPLERLTAQLGMSKAPALENKEADAEASKTGTRKGKKNEEEAA